MPNHPDRSKTAESISHLLEVIADTGDDRRLGVPPAQTGFSPLDLALDGGLMPHELVLLGGLPGAGKTICALQWARSFARQGRDVLFLTYELDQLTLLTRLLIQELAVTASQLDSTARIAMRRSVVSMMLGTTPIADVVDAYPDVEKAMTDLHSESENLRVVQASTQTTSAEEVRRLVSERVGTGRCRHRRLPSEDSRAGRLEPSGAGASRNRVAQGDRRRQRRHGRGPRLCRGRSHRHASTAALATERFGLASA